MIVVSDTSPILNLARIGHLDLLATLYCEVVMPTGVNRELTAALGESAVLDVARPVLG